MIIFSMWISILVPQLQAKEALSQNVRAEERLKSLKIGGRKNWEFAFSKRDFADSWP